MRHSGTAIAAALGVGVATLAAASPLRAAPTRTAARTPLVGILAPSADARTSARTIRIRVALRGVTRGFKAEVGQTNVTRRFGPAHDGVRTAVLRRGRDFKRGRNYLFVTAGVGVRQAADQRLFVAESRGTRLLSLATPRRSGARSTYRIRYRLRRSTNALTVALNGHRVRIRGGDRLRGPHELAIGVSDGLRRGVNHVVLRASRNATGTTDRELRRFRVAPGVALASAGADVTTQPGGAVRLTARRASAGAGGGRLVYRWQIVARPPRSRALIENPSSRRAKFVPDVPGGYRVRLLIGQARTGAGARTRSAASPRASKAASASCAPNLLPSGLARAAGHEQRAPAAIATPTTTTSGGSTGPLLPLTPVNPLAPPACVVPTGQPTPPLPADATGVTADVLDVTSNANNAPIGNWIQTIAADGSTEIQAGATGVSRYPAAGTTPTPNAWAQLLVLNSTALTPDPNAPGGGDLILPLSAAGSLPAEIAKLPSSDTVIISGMNAAQPNTPATATALQALTKAVSSLGENMPPSAGTQRTMILTGKWSMLGVVGSPGQTYPGHTYQNLDGFTETPAPGTPAGSLPGSLDGYLQQVNTQAYTYVSSNYEPIDTRASGSSDTVNVVKVGSQSYASQPIPAGALALHILVLSTDAPGGAPSRLDQQTFVITTPEAQPTKRATRTRGSICTTGGRRHRTR